MLFVSSFELGGETEPFDEGLELPLRNDFRELGSAGDFGAVRLENPEGGLAVRMTGVGAASSSRLTSEFSVTKSRWEG